MTDSYPSLDILDQTITENSNIDSIRPRLLIAADILSSCADVIIHGSAAGRLKRCMTVNDNENITALPFLCEVFRNISRQP